MTTLVIGANGQIGRLFCKLASEAGMSLRAMLRGDDQRPFFEALGIETVVGDLEGEIAHAFEGCDPVVFSAGSGGATGADKTLLVDLYGAVRAIDESATRRVSHFVMVSAMRSDQPLASPPGLRHYMVAKLLADEHLERSGVPYTTLRPGRLTDTAASRRVRCDGRGIDISRENVALCIAAALSRGPQNRRIDLLDGDLPIEEIFSD